MIKFQISNFQFPISNKKFSRNEKGFTLIELLVVMIAFMLTGTIIASVIFTHVKAIDKTNTETTIRQTGSGIMAQISKDIRNAGTISLNDAEGPVNNKPNAKVCVSGTEYETLYTNPKLDPKRAISYQCSPLSSSTPPVLPNIRKHVEINSSPGLIELLVDTKSIVVNDCKFTCQVAPGGLPIIAIKFTLDEKTSSGTKSKSIGEKISIPFTTSVQMRNF